MDALAYLRVEALSRRFEEVAAVDRVDLEIAHREVFALLGPSGCGKSTLLRLLAGIEEPSSGRIVLDGEDITQQPPYIRATNMMFQSYALFPHMTVAANIAFGLKQDRLPRAVIRQRVERILDMVEMAPLATRMPHQLSGGQQQRVALARVLVKEPKLLLLDEPMGALDRKIREHTRLELLALIHGAGVTCMMVTHDREEAMSMADRVGVMSEGRIVQVGTPADIYDRPNSRFTADLIGDTNLFQGTLAASDGGFALAGSLDLEQGMRIAEAGGARPGASVWVSVRPERIEVQRDPTAAGRNGCSGTVRDIAYLGGASVFHVQLRSGRVVRAVVPSARWQELPPPARGEAVFLSWRPAACVVLTA